VVFKKEERDDITKGEGRSQKEEVKGKKYWKEKRNEEQDWSFLGLVPHTLHRSVGRFIRCSLQDEAGNSLETSGRPPAMEESYRNLRFIKRHHLRNGKGQCSFRRNKEIAVRKTG
jgi:hypothetical protein